MSNFTVGSNIYKKLFYDIIHFVHIAVANICRRKQFSVLPKEGNWQDDRNENFHRLYCLITFTMFLTDYIKIKRLKTHDIMISLSLVKKWSTFNDVVLQSISRFLDFQLFVFV